jgi:hypothetical protein
MKYFASVGALFIGLVLASLALAQDNAYAPSLGDIMGQTQLRHIKLWFAGKLQNWDLATYELGQIKQSLATAAALYQAIPAEDVINTADPMQAIRAAIEAKDGTKFAAAFADLTQACNACHQHIGRGYIVIQLPTASPFSDQSFAPR